MKNKYISNNLLKEKRAIDRIVACGTSGLIGRKEKVLQKTFLSYLLLHDSYTEKLYNSTMKVKDKSSRKFFKTLEDFDKFMKEVYQLVK